MMKTILEGLRICKENNIYDKHINIALGSKKIPLTFKEANEQIKMKYVK